MKAEPVDPFLEPRHRELSSRVRTFGNQHLRALPDDDADPLKEVRVLAGALAREGFLEAAVLPPYGTMDVCSLVVAREGLGYFSLLASSTFGMQGLASHPISLAGNEAQKKRWLPAVVSGEVLCSLALTEPESGSDLAGVRTRADPDGSLWRLSGLKTFVSNAGAAGVYVVLARSSEAEGRKGLSMFLVDAEAPGIGVRRVETLAPQPLGELRFDSAPAVLLGEEGKGYGLALASLDAFRPAAGAAACGLASRAFDEALRWSLTRRQFGQYLSQLQSVQMALAEMYVDLAGARLVVYQAAWAKDHGAARIPREGAAAKLAATEMAQRVVDRAVQIHGGQGVMRGATVERLYREVRSLRIHEGTSEIQKLVIARELIKESR
jgi:acyl-CoA dehydrogenase